MSVEIGKAIQQAVQTEVKNAIIISPRFSDYRVQDFIDTGAFESIDTELNALISKIKTAPQDKQKTDKLEADIKELKGTISSIQSSLSDPKGAVFGEINKIIGEIPGAKFIPVILAALATQAVINKIINTLLQPGGPFDKRLRIILEKQEEQFLSRLEQKRRQIGLDQVVISLFDGFGNANGRLTTNTLDQVKNTGVSDLGLNEIKIGLK